MNQQISILSICFGLAACLAGGRWLYIRKIRRDRAWFVFRDKQSAEELLVDCGLVGNSGAVKIALAVREVLAELGNVPAETIHSKDRFERELTCLNFSHDFDVSEFGEKLSRKTGLTLGRPQLERIPHPDVPPHGMTVADFIGRILLIMNLVG